MNRRKLLSLATLSTLTWAITPLSAQTWQPYQNLTDNKDPWKAERTAEAIKLLYPDKEILKSDKIYIKAPQSPENGGSIPIYIKTKLEAKRVMLFQDANPTSLVGIFEVPKDGLVDYYLHIKLRQTAFVTVLVEDYNGKVYQNNIEIDIPIGGCPG